MPELQTFDIRPVSLEQVSDLIALSEDAGWSQPEEEIREIIIRSGKYILGAFAGNKLIGVAAVFPLPESGVGWLCEVIVSSRWRRRGAARMILEQLLPIADADFPVLRLCATAMGRPLYEKNGFVPLTTLLFGIPVFEKDPPENGDIQRLSFMDLPEMVELDKANYGSDRAAVLRNCLERFPTDAWCLKRGSKMTGFIIRAGNKLLAQSEVFGDFAALIYFANCHAEKPLPVLISRETAEQLPCSIEVIFELTAMQRGDVSSALPVRACTMLPDIG